MLALFNAMVGLALFGPLAFSAPVWADDALVIEVLTTSEQPVVGAEHERLRTATITTYAVDKWPCVYGGPPPANLHCVRFV